jgi:hypothetical protein
MKRILARSILGVSGMLLLAIGSAVLFKAETFAAANGIVLADSPSVLSEYRAPGGMLITSAVLILLGAVRTRFIRSGLALSALVYCSYGVSRLVGMISDGMPSIALTQATVIELLLGSLCLIALLRLNQNLANAGQR